MSERKAKLAIYVFIVAVAFLLIFIRTPVFEPLRFTIIKATSLPIQIVLFPFREFKKAVFYHRTYGEYLRLRKEVATLKGRLIGMEEILRENNRLEQLLEFKRKSLYSSAAANVIGRDPSNWNSMILIDVGREDGVEPGMAVVNALGVVGKVTDVARNKSKVILITDPSFSVAALARRSREVGLVSGTLQGVCRMRYLSSNADVLIGDTVITSKLSSSFPEGLIVGEIFAVHHSTNSDTVECHVRPSVALSQIEEVLVILNN